MEQSHSQDRDIRQMDITCLVPHRGKMLLIDEVVEYNRENMSLTAAFAAKREWLGNYAAIEYMAQTAAALAGAFDIDGGWTGEPRPGFLLGTRKLDLRFDAFKEGERYLSVAKNEFADGEAASFACEVRNSAGEVIATAVLNAYRPSGGLSVN